MATTTKKSWLDVFTDNYNGTSDLAKTIETKETYKGDNYIPWATMERLTYMCDPDAEFTNVENINGGLVHTDVMCKDQVNIQKGETISETHSQMFSHFVKVKLVFMGKEFIEDYPIQDQDYTAATIYNQNLVNRALQRAKAKIASRATGLGLKLYEGKDLQFEEAVKEDKKPELPVVETKNAQSEEKKAPKKDENAQKSEKTVQKVEEKQVETQSSVETKKEPVKNNTDNVDSVVIEIVDLIKNTDVEVMNNVLQKINVPIMKKYQIAISTEMSENELIEMLSNKEIFKDPNQLLKTFKTLINAQN